MMFLVSINQEGDLITEDISSQSTYLNCSQSVSTTIASESLAASIIEFEVFQELIDTLLEDGISRSISICLGLTFGSYIHKLAPSSIRFLHILIADDSLVSLVSALKAKPNIAIFLPLTVPKSF